MAKAAKNNNPGRKPRTNTYIPKNFETPEPEEPKRYRSAFPPSLYDPNKYKIIDTPHSLTVTKKGDPYYYKHYPFDQLAIGQSFGVPLKDDYGNEDPNGKENAIKKG